MHLIGKKNIRLGLNGRLEKKPKKKLGNFKDLGKFQVEEEKDKSWVEEALKEAPGQARCQRLCKTYLGHESTGWLKRHRLDKRLKA